MHTPVFEAFVELSLLVVGLYALGIRKLLLIDLPQAFRDPERWAGIF